ncbi:hypothetical protein [Megalodesulfovibrio paquesii]
MPYRLVAVVAAVLLVVGLVPPALQAQQVQTQQVQPPASADLQQCDLQQWVGRLTQEIPDSPEGVPLHADPQFLKALRVTVGEAIYAQYTAILAQPNPALRMVRNRPAMGHLVVAGILHLGDPAFEATCFLTPARNTLDVCWETPAEPAASRFYLHNGTALPIQPGDCQHLDYDMLTSPDYPALLAEQQNRVLGIWKGTGGGRLGEQELARVEVSLRFFRDGLTTTRFQEKLRLVLPEGQCFGNATAARNIADIEVEGLAKMEYGLVRLMVKAVSNPALYKTLSPGALSLDQDRLRWQLDKNSPWMTLEREM